MRRYRRVWTELAEQWLARIALLPPAIRAQLGRLRAGDWQQPREALLKQGVHPRVVEHLVSAGAQDLLPVTMRGRKPADPFLQLWIAAAIQSLDDVEIVRLKARPLEPAITSLPIPAGGARLVLVEAPAGDAVALGINGTPLMQMMVFGVNGQVEEERGPLRVTRIAPEAGSPLQVLVTKGSLRVCSPCPVGQTRSISSAPSLLSRPSWIAFPFRRRACRATCALCPARW